MLFSICLQTSCFLERNSEAVRPLLSLENCSHVKNDEMDEIVICFLQTYRFVVGNMCSRSLKQTIYTTGRLVCVIRFFIDIIIIIQLNHIFGLSNLVRDV